MRREQKVELRAPRSVCDRQKVNLSAPSLRSAVVELRALRSVCDRQKVNLSALSLRSAVVKLSAEVGRDRLS